MFNKRKLGQQKRRAKENIAEGTVGCLGSLFGLVFKIFFYPFTVIYYGFIKKDVNKNWRLFHKICALIIWLFITYSVIENIINNPKAIEDDKIEVKIVSKSE
jgi:hypothetical protein